MDQSPSGEADSHPASQEVPLILWNPKVHYRVHSSLPIVRILKHIHPVHTPQHNFHKIQSNINSSMTRSSEWCLPFNFCNQRICQIFHACYILRQSRPLPVYSSQAWIHLIGSWITSVFIKAALRTLRINAPRSPFVESRNWLSDYFGSPRKNLNEKWATFFPSDPPEPPLNNPARCAHAPRT